MSASRMAAACPLASRRVMALDRRGDALGKAPAADKDRADQRMVDPELATLAPHPRLGRPPPGVDFSNWSYISDRTRPPTS